MVALAFSGAFDNDAGASSFVMDLSGIAEAAPEDEIPPGFAELFTEMEIRQIGDTSYLRFPFFTAFLSLETEWISFPSEESFSSEVAPITPVNPTEFLRMFESVGGSVTEVGADTIRGAETTHYVVVFDMEHLLRVSDPGQLEDLENLGPLPFDELPMDIWVSSDGLVHRFEIMLDASLADVPEGEGFDRLVMRFDLFDHGLPVDIVAPPAGEVTGGGDLGGIFGA